VRKHFARAAAAVLLVSFVFSLAACADNNKPSKSNPVTLTVWHTYVEGMQNSFDSLLDEFNRTVGKENGITIKVTSVANSSELSAALIAAAKKDPGAGALPDMAVVYPQVAVTLKELGVLADIGAQFSEEELSAYVPQFIEEGLIDGKLYLMPVAKSTEVLYLNKTVFDRFSAATGVTMDSLATFEGIASASVRYYEWTDAQTPDIIGDGATFYYPDSLFNYAMIGMKQLGGNIVYNNGINLTDPLFSRIWENYYLPAVSGGIKVFDTYANYLFQTGEIVCATSTSAGASFYPSTITYPDNTKEDVEILILPYPTFEGGEKIAVQRGGGLCVAASTPAKEYAAGVFLKWFTAAENNLEFTAATGYMPVNKAAFDEILAGNLPEIENETVKKSLIAGAEMQKEYTFFFPPVFDGFDTLQSNFAKQLRTATQDARDEYIRMLQAGDENAFDEVTENALARFIDGFK